ncbi:extracellular solute-binding protein [Actinosynnema sp. NPDC053489]|uniref:extracellular solute-binding protein n=1 Tax=Actinosynnema sp. NPDC053489 TaxID=3363916 RepID=UPI0037C8FFBF
MILNRRGFLTLTAAAGGTLLVGCGGPATQHTGTALGEDALAKVLPSYHPVDFAKPDLPGVNGSTAGYLKFPTALVDAVGGKVLDGGEVTAMTPAFWPLPPGLGQNSYWDAVNQRIGGVVRFEQVQGQDYQAKLGAMVAARQVPEVTVMPTFTIPPRFSEGVGQVFADLTDLLSGDKVEDYPLLANIPTETWHSCVYGGKLYGVPFRGELFPETIMYRKDVVEKLGGTAPKNVDEFYQLCKKVNDPAANRWALGDVFRSMVRVFGDPGDWSRDPSGKVVNKIETTAYKEAVKFTRSLYDAGFVHPNVVAGSNTGINELFEGGQMLIHLAGLGYWGEAVRRQRPANPSFGLEALPLFAHDGGKPRYSVSPPTAMVTLFRKDLSVDRIKELLRLANFVAAPVGTTEHYLINYGVEGKHSTRDANGAPGLNELGRKEITLTYGFVSAPPDTIIDAQYPDFVKAKHAWLADAYEHQVRPLTFGMRIEEPAEHSKLGQEYQDKTYDILRGRVDVGEVDALAEKWRKAGGDELREFYDKALRDAGR